MWGVKIGGLKLAKWGWQGAECIAILPLIMTKKPKLLRFLVDNLGNILGDFIDFLTQFNSEFLR